MNPERPELRLVREKLESVLAPELASSILFESLGEVGGMPPATGEATLALVEGPLARVIGRRVRGAEGKMIVTELIDLLRQIVGPTMTPVTPLSRAQVRELEITLEMPEAAQGQREIPIQKEQATGESGQSSQPTPSGQTREQGTQRQQSGQSAETGKQGKSKQPEEKAA